jgi:hypothetical protein
VRGYQLVCCYLRVDGERAGGGANDVICCYLRVSGERAGGGVDDVM